jgi:hypothetical protein
MSYAETEQKYHYIGRCRICGATLASVGDSPERRAMTAQGVSHMVLAGLIVERVRSEDVRFAKADCGCPRKAKEGMR